MGEISTLFDDSDLVPQAEVDNDEPAQLDKKDEVELTDEQWQKIRDLWNSRKDNPPSLMELIKVAFDQDNLDGRSREGRAIRKKLSEAKMSFKTSKFVPMGNIELTKDQEEYIRNNHKTMKSVEMARILFSNPALTNLNQETRTVIAFVKTLGTDKTFEDPEEIATEKYNPPKKVVHAIARINRYTNNSLEEGKLTGKQKKDIAALIGFLNNYRFNRQINTYEKIQDRELFESSFIRYTYDKHDLTEEEVDQYVVLATEVVIGATIQGRSESLSRMLEQTASSQADGGPKISMALVEAINTAQTEYNQCVMRQQKLLESLKVKRSEKEGRSKAGNASVLNLVQAWKDEESRKRMIRLAQFQKEKLKAGIKDLETIDELKARIYGLSIDEALNG